MRNIVTVAGTDPLGGAGIAGDLKTIWAHGCHGLMVVSAVVSQNSRGVMGTEAVSSKTLLGQLEAIEADVNIHGMKIGMIYDENNMDCLIDWCTRWNKKLPIVYDPVLRATSGGDLMKHIDLDRVYNLIRCVTLVTPNVHELIQLTGKDIVDETSWLEAGEELARKCRVHVYLKGGHRLHGQEVVDYIIYQKEDVYMAERLVSSRTLTNNTHGTGCALSSSLACHLAKGDDVLQAAREAKAYISMAIGQGYDIGNGYGPIGPVWGGE